MAVNGRNGGDYAPRRTWDDTLLNEARPTCPTCHQQARFSVRREDHDRSVGIVLVFEAQCCGRIACWRLSSFLLEEAVDPHGMIYKMRGNLEAELREATNAATKKIRVIDPLHVMTMQIFASDRFGHVVAQENHAFTVVMNPALSKGELATSIALMAQAAREGFTIHAEAEFGRYDYPEHWQFIGIRFLRNTPSYETGGMGSAWVSWSHAPPHMVFERDGVEVAARRVSNLEACIDELGPFADEHNESGPGVAWLRIGYGVWGDEIYFEQWKLDAERRVVLRTGKRSGKMKELRAR